MRLADIVSRRLKALSFFCRQNRTPRICIPCSDFKDFHQQGFRLGVKRFILYQNHSLVFFNHPGPGQKANSHIGKGFCFIFKADRINPVRQGQKRIRFYITAEGKYPAVRLESGDKTRGALTLRVGQDIAHI
jgi:hypothetical protein